METTDYRKVDRSEWTRGSWDNEPDRLEFEHAGLPCLLARASPGHWCGYVAVPPGHPLHGVAYNRCCEKPLPCTSSIDWCDHRPEEILEVHGGITYSDFCAGGICHVPKPGEAADVYWFGFDAAHMGDRSPRRERFNSPGSQYRDIHYMRAETEKLAEQLKDIRHER